MKKKTTNRKEFEVIVKINIMAKNANEAENKIKEELSYKLSIWNDILDINYFTKEVRK